ncbi:DUF3685 domain-containing protein [Romeria aff. gracilis LEGE 07310]|uniref:DUF3685 domain-containing protein n=1 Tax=Vasconcelosia minhoensis LEGE 07310 TaxID=915328 RepID=A0A8J7A8Q5_9CYAN|nr:DUF3685 domain-containing protein [Romeria gracilis]MBE9078115.1 DUF3685 domain-containing protein [Romeria aff. gracilis LEGE 07310]
MSDRPLQLVLVDEDPVFRLGLRVWLEQLNEFQVVAEASTGAETLDILRSRRQSFERSLDQPELRAVAAQPIDLVILDLGLGAGDPEAMPGLRLCQQIKTEFVQLPVLVLSAQLEPVLQAAAAQVGADGYGARGMPVRQLAQLIRRVAAGEPGRLPLPERQSRCDFSAEPPAIPGPLTAMRISLRLSAMQQIDQTLADLETIAQPRYWINRAIVDGKRRELRAARWLVGQLWATPRFDDLTRRTDTPDSAAWLPRSESESQSRQTGTALLPLPSALVAAAPGRFQADPADVQATVFEGVFRKLQRRLENVSDVPLEIDILRVEKKRELLYIVLRQLEDRLEDLRHSQVQPGQLPERSRPVLEDLWDTVVIEFFGKYYTVQISGVEEAVVSLIQQEKPIVKAEILEPIPLVPSLLGHWLFQEPLLIDGAPYLATTPEAIRHSEILLENLIIQVGNAVMQPLLNRLSDVEPIKKSLYSRRLMSSREIERFRNELAWRYRWDQWVAQPKAIFESRYRLFILTAAGITETSVYAPRRDELNQLSGLQWATTLAFEARDALAPRVRAAIAFVGSGLVYVLTEVVGRGIGLVGRGILKGVGSAWQDSRGRPRRPRDREPERKFNEWE